MVKTPLTVMRNVERSFLPNAEYSTPNTIAPNAPNTTINNKLPYLLRSQGDKELPWQVEKIKKKILYYFTA